MVFISNDHSPKKNTESDLNLLNSEDFGIKNPLNAGWLNLGEQCLLSCKNWLTWIPVFDHHQIKIGKRILDKIMTFLFFNYQFPVCLLISVGFNGSLRQFTPRRRNKTNAFTSHPAASTSQSQRVEPKNISTGVQLGGA